MTTTGPEAARRYIRATCPPLRPDDAARLAQDFETIQGRAAERDRDERRLRIARAVAAFVVYVVVILGIAVLGAWALQALAVAAHAVTDPLGGGAPW